MEKAMIRMISGTLLIILVMGAHAMAMGTALVLGAGQEFRFDLPLDAGKDYVISMALRTDLDDATVTMTVCQILNNNEVVEQYTSRHELGPNGAWTSLSIPEVQTLATPGRFELVVTADKEGRYYWKDLKVERNYASSLPAQEFWSEKLATQGTFYTGLVVDARHLDVRRGMSPRIYSASGQLLYGGVLAGQEIVQSQGVVGYGSELNADLLNRITVDADYPYVAPLMVEAVAVADAAQTGVFVSEEDTRRILEAMAQYDFFARYAVIFLIK